MFSNCHNVNPNATAVGGIYGYSHTTGGFDGGQAEHVRVPFADVGPMKIPDTIDDDNAALCTDAYPTGYQGAEMAQIKRGDSVVVFGAGPVGLFAARSAWFMGALGGWRDSSRRRIGCFLATVTNCRRSTDNSGFRCPLSKQAVPSLVAKRPRERRRIRRPRASKLAAETLRRQNHVASVWPGISTSHESTSRPGRSYPPIRRIQRQAQS